MLWHKLIADYTVLSLVKSEPLAPPVMVPWVYSIVFLINVATEKQHVWTMPETSGGAVVPRPMHNSIMPHLTPKAGLYRGFKRKAVLMSLAASLWFLWKKVDLKTAFHFGLPPLVWAALRSFPQSPCVRNVNERWKRERKLSSVFWCEGVRLKLVPTFRRKSIVAIIHSLE